MLGYHVHEKAVLGVTVTSALTALASKRSAGEYLMLVITATYALFPLLEGAAEHPLKVSCSRPTQQCSLVFIVDVTHVRGIEVRPALVCAPEIWKWAFLGSSEPSI